MSFTLLSNLLTVPIKRVCATHGETFSKGGGGGAGIGVGYAGQLQQVRRHAPICGPPRFPMSTGQKLIFGWGSILIMMILPYWALSQVPRWSAMHNNRPYGDEEEEPPEE
ncbi:uncharacterized protein [Drosophila virilis]|uniref:Uncharacterized protein n=1 Tax=Drosophila virilis TaxID=7244 RepID=B4LV41_DROVI|nr:uncharacterized protein LOC6627394 [Drosophila virilis]EDW64301.1 uncharacterized protein Dvir_GJ23307 [Drosophila virilis]